MGGRTFGHRNLHRLGSLHRSLHRLGSHDLGLGVGHDGQDRPVNHSGLGSGLDSRLGGETVGTATGRGQQTLLLHRGGLQRDETPPHLVRLAVVVAPDMPAGEAGEAADVVDDVVELDITTAQHLHRRHDEGTPIGLAALGGGESGVHGISGGLSVRRLGVRRRRHSPSTLIGR